MAWIFDLLYTKVLDHLLRLISKVHAKESVLLRACSAC